MKDNRGFSLVELLVVILLIGLLISVLAMSVSGIFTSEAQKTIKNVNSLISKSKVQSMTRAGDVCVVVYRNADGSVIGEYCENGTVISTEKLGGSFGTLSYTDSDGNTVVLADPANKLYIAFERDTGALKTIGDSASGAGAAGADTAYCSTILMQISSREFEITLIQSTGKHGLAEGGR